MTRTKIVLLSTLLIAGIGCLASAQVVLRSGVFPSGGGTISGGTYSGAGTIGQPAIGRATGTTYSVGAGFWGTGGTVVGIEEPTLTETPAEFALKQNYPNPFNPGTTIKYALPKAATVNLVVYDMLGREVSVLVNEKRNAGVHEVRFNSSNLASGVYFYRLQAGDFVSTKKMQVVK